MCVWSEILILDTVLGRMLLNLLANWLDTMLGFSFSELLSRQLVSDQFGYKELPDVVVGIFIVSIHI